MPGKGIRGKAGDTLLTIESVKSAEDVYFPVSGEVIETTHVTWYILNLQVLWT